MQPTCKASEIALASRIDYIFVSPALLPAVRGFQVDHSDTFPTHQVLQLRLEVGPMGIDTGRFRKPVNLVAKFDQCVNTLFGLDSSLTEDEHRKRQKQKLHVIMEDTRGQARGRLQAAAVRGDTSALWKIWSSTIEQAFCTHFGTKGSESRSLSGRGTVNIIKATDAPKLPNQCIPGGAARAQHHLADRFARQQRRLGHTADRAKLLCSSSYSVIPLYYNHIRHNLLISQNSDTLNAFYKDCILTTKEDQSACKAIRFARADPHRLYLTAKRLSLEFGKRQDAARQVAKQLGRSELDEALANTKSGVKNMSKMLNSEPAKPLRLARRDRSGPNGEAIGTITTNPMEIDSIARRAWTAVYNGNFTDLAAAAEQFMGKYSKLIFSMDAEFELFYITGADVKTACLKAKATAAGMDGWAPAEFAFLSDTVFDWLAVMYNLIEKGAERPDGTHRARAAYLEKKPGVADKVLEFRVLLILPTLYRRWASIRLKHLEPWADLWHMKEAFAGTGSQRAEDAWYELATKIEAC